MQTAAATYAVSMTIVVAALLYLRSLPESTPGLGWWAAAFGISVLRHVVLAMEAQPHVGALGVLADSMAAASAVCLLAGTFIFLGRRLSYTLLLGAWALVSAAASYAVHRHNPWQGSVILSTFVGLAAFYTGSAFMTGYGSVAQAGYRLVGVSFALWGLYRLLQPFVSGWPRFSLWGSLLGQGLSVTIGIALIITVLRGLQQRALGSEEDARAAQSRLESIVEANPVPLLIAFEDDSIIFTNRRAAESLGLEAEAAMGHRLAPYFDRPQEYRRLMRRLKHEGRIDGAVVRMRRADGALFWGLLSVRPIALAGEQAVLISFSDITERKSLEEELHRLATTDPLTGILDRRRYLELSDQELKRASRYHKEVAIVMIDIDHFKEVNDRHGHAAGDEVLRQFANTCRAALREQDLFGRLGGEEFALTLPETNAGDAREVADRLRQAVHERPARTERGEVSVTVSIGITQGIQGDDMDTALRRADRAMYRAKSGGRDRIEVTLADDAGS